MAIGTVGAIIASAVIGAGTSMYAANQQEDAMREAEEARQRAVDEAEAERRRIASETRPDEETAQGIEYGSGDGDVGSTTDFLVERPANTQLGNTGRSGLGFNI